MTIDAYGIHFIAGLIRLATIPIVGTLVWTWLKSRMEYKGADRLWNDLLWVLMVGAVAGFLFSREELYVRFYALILMAAMLVGAWLTAVRTRQHGLDQQHIWNGLMWAILPALVGARLYHVFTPSPSALTPDGQQPLTVQWYLQNPLQILAIWNGGLGIYGGILGGSLGAVAYCIQNKLSPLLWLDLTAPGVALGQVIGRWANLINHELYGGPTTLPWAIHIPPEKRLPHFTQYETFHPLFLYESLWMLGTCLLLIGIERRFKGRLREGSLTLIYLMSYAVIRFLLDFLRLDSNTVGGITSVTTAQWVSVCTFLAAGAVLFWRNRAMPAVPTKAAAPRSR